MSAKRKYHNGYLHYCQECEENGITPSSYKLFSKRVISRREYYAKKEKKKELESYTCIMAENDTKMSDEKVIFAIILVAGFLMFLSSLFINR